MNSRTLRVLLRLFLGAGLLWAICRPRTGLDIYAEMFVGDIRPCVNVLNSHDANLPILDADIYLRLTTCPDEIKRIIKLRPYPIFQSCRKPDYMGSFQPPDEWFHPEELGNKIIEFSWKPDSELAEGIYFFASHDSTRAFIVDVGR